MKLKNFYLIPLCVGVSASLVSCGAKTYTIPTFDEGRQVDIIAYAPSCPAKVLTGSNVSTITEENYKNIAKAGFTHTLSLYEGFYGVGVSLEDSLKKSYQVCNEQSLQILDYCQKYGLKHYARDWSAYDMGIYNGYSNPLAKFRSELDSYEEYKNAYEILFPEATSPSERQYFKHPAYAGNYLSDEVFYGDLKILGEINKIYLERMNELGVENVRPINNLLPCHAGGNSLGPGWEEYADAYYAYVGKKVNSISYDFYPFMKSKSGSNMKDLYLYNYQIAAERCNDYGCDLEVYVQTCGDFTGMRDLSGIGDVRYQLYAGLGFGAKTFTYYQYGIGKNEETGQYGILDLNNGKLTKNYDYVKVANNEIKNFEKVVTCYDYDNIICKLGEGHEVNNLFDMLSHERGSVSSSDRVSIVNATEDTALTLMKRKTDGSDAFMLLNASDPYYRKSDSVTLKVKNAKALLTYKLGERQILESNNGVFKFDLEPGEGTFIVPLN